MVLPLAAALVIAVVSAALMKTFAAVANADWLGIVGVLFIFGTSFIVIFILPMIAVYRVRWVLPSSDDVNRGTQFYSRINYRSGVLVGKDYKIRWEADYSSTLTRKPEIVFKGADGEELYRIRRLRYLPPCFQMLGESKVVGTIRLKSILLNKYTLELNEGILWTFLMPLFAVHFRAFSTAGDRLWIQLGPRTKLQWIILVEPEFNNLAVLAAIAFIHRRWYL